MNMGHHTSIDTIAALKTGVVHNIQHVRSAVQAAEGIEGLEHLAPAMVELETFCMIALRLMGKCRVSVVIDAMRDVEIEARIDAATMEALP